jgi:cation diffusion facilitator family transporter
VGGALSEQRRLGAVLGLNLLLIAVLVAAGVNAGSLGVLAAAGDTAADSTALVLGLIAIAVRDRSSHPRRALAIPAVALINGVALVVVSVLIVAESVGRLSHGTAKVDGLPVVIVSVATMAVLLLGALVLGGSAANEDVHMRSVLLDTLADAAAAGAVAVAGAVIAVTGRFFWLDPALALCVALVILVPALSLCGKALAALRGNDMDFDCD